MQDDGMFNAGGNMDISEPSVLNRASLSIRSNVRSDQIAQDIVEVRYMCISRDGDALFQ